MLNNAVFMKDDVYEEVRLVKGDSATIKLKGLAAAGYQWNYKLDDNNDCIIISKNFELSKSNVKNGSSADEIFTITPRNLGSATIHFTQHRSWEKSAAPANTKKVKIIVEDKH